MDYFSCSKLRPRSDTYSLSGWHRAIFPAINVLGKAGAHLVNRCENFAVGDAVIGEIHP